MASPDSGLRGNKGAPRGQDDRTRDPHALPVSTVQALIDQWRDWAKEHWDAVGSYEPSAPAALVQVGHAQAFEKCADQLLALLASPSLPEARSVDFVELLELAKAQVKASPLWFRFIDGTPLENDVACWMATFALEAVKRHTPVPAKPRFGCAKCQRDYDYTPFTWSVEGIPARTYYFCSPACRTAWLLDDPASPSLHRQEQNDK